MEFADSFTLASAPQAIYSRLLGLDEFTHLAEARVAFVFSERTPMLHGHPCQAFIASPRVQGPFRQYFDWSLAQFCLPLFAGEVPDFVVMVDAAIWPSLTEEQQERLVYHELCHVVVREDEYGVPKLQDDGRPSLRLIPHDYEFFDAEVRRYGPSVCAVDGAAVAIAEGYRDAERRKRPVRAA